MVEEIEGLDEEISPIEKWQASVIAHKAAVTDKRVAPEIPQHPDGHKSTKQQERASQDLERLQIANHSMMNRKPAAHGEPGPTLRKDHRGRSPWIVQSRRLPFQEARTFK
jgi:hypothetical protein